MNYGNGGIGWGGWLVMLIMMIAFWGAIAWVIVTLIRHNHARPHYDAQPTADMPPDPLRILDERFARGDIDEEEYHRRRDVLRGGK